MVDALKNEKKARDQSTDHVGDLRAPMIDHYHHSQPQHVQPNEDDNYPHPHPKKEALLTTADSKALYPSLNAKESARIIREEVTMMEFNIDQFSWKKIAGYFAMTSDPWEW